MTLPSQAVEHLSISDPFLAPIIAKHGPYTIQSHTNYYQELVDSIISQQLSVKAAATIQKRFCALFGNEDQLPSPEKILSKDIEELRSCGLSRPKASYIQDLALHVIEGRIKFDHLEDLTNEEIVAELTAVKGIGVWTVHMFLIFCMGRLNVLAYGDLGVRNGIKLLYELDHVPDQKEVEAIATQYHWNPYESVACRYIWKSLDNTPAL